MIGVFSLKGSAIVFFGWLLGYAITQLVMSGLSSVDGYSIIMGWWFSAYMSAKFKVDILSILPAFVVYLTVFLAMAFSGWPWFYRDVDSLTIYSGLGIGVLQSFFFVSPVFFNFSFEKITTLLHLK